MSALDNTAASREPGHFYDPCVRGGCGEPKNAPVHDEASDEYQHRYADDGAPSGYEDVPNVRS